MLCFVLTSIDNFIKVNFHRFKFKKKFIIGNNFENNRQI